MNPRSLLWPTPGYRPARAARPSTPARFAIRATPEWFSSRSTRAEWLALLASTRSTLAAARAFNARARS